MQLDLTVHSWFADSAWKTEIKLNWMKKLLTISCHTWPWIYECFGARYMMLSSTGTTNKGQIRSSLAVALRAHLHLLSRQSLLTHTGTICILLQPKQRLLPPPSDLHSLSDLLFVLYSYCVTEYVTAIWVSCLEHLLLLRRQFKS